MASGADSDFGTAGAAPSSMSIEELRLRAVLGVMGLFGMSDVQRAVGIAEEIVAYATTGAPPPADEA